MKVLKIIVLIPLFLFMVTYVQFPSITWDERVIYFQITYMYPTLDYLNLLN